MSFQAAINMKYPFIATRAKRGDVIAQYKLGRWFQREGKINEARQWFELAAQQRHGPSHYQLAKIHMQLSGDLKSAGIALAQVIKRDPSLIHTEDFSIQELVDMSNDTIAMYLLRSPHILEKLSPEDLLCIGETSLETANYVLNQKSLLQRLSTGQCVQLASHNQVTVMLLLSAEDISAQLDSDQIVKLAASSEATALFVLQQDRLSQKLDGNQVIRLGLTSPDAAHYIITHEELVSHLHGLHPADFLHVETCFPATASYFLRHLDLFTTMDPEQLTHFGKLARLGENMHDVAYAILSRSELSHDLNGSHLTALAIHTQAGLQHVFNSTHLYCKLNQDQVVRLGCCYETAAQQLLQNPDLYSPLNRDELTQVLQVAYPSHSVIDIALLLLDRQDFSAQLSANDILALLLLSSRCTEKLFEHQYLRDMLQELSAVSWLRLAAQSQQVASRLMLNANCLINLTGDELVSLYQYADDKYLDESKIAFHLLHHQEYADLLSEAQRTDLLSLSNAHVEQGHTLELATDKTDGHVQIEPSCPLVKFFLAEEMNPYDILGIDTTCDHTEVKTAYETLAHAFRDGTKVVVAKINHEDFQRITQAHELLSNETSRNEYDLFASD